QWLTGKLPYDVTGCRHEILDRILTLEPIRPSAACRDIRGDLETILWSCLAKRRAERYTNAGELAEDVRNCLERKPIKKRHTRIWYLIRRRTRQFIERRPL